MDPAPLLDRVVDDEGITAGLDEPEGTFLIATLAARVRKIAASADEESARRQVDELCRNARKIAETVVTFRDAGETEARTKATQYGLIWPKGAATPAKLLHQLLADNQAG